MPADLRQFGATLSRILPFLAQEKMQRDQIRQWLERNLQEISAREASQARLQTQEAQDAIARILAQSTTQHLEPIPGGGLQMPAELMRRLDPRYTAGIRVPPEMTGELGSLTDALTQMYGQFQEGQTISPDILRAVVTQVKGDIPAEIVTRGESGKLTRGQQALTSRGYDLEERGLGIREEELAAREREAGGVGRKDAAAVMKEAQNDIDLAIKQYSGVGSFMSASPDSKRALSAIVKKANKRIDDAAKSLGIESPIKTREEMFKAGLAILSRYATQGELPSSYYLILMGYDPDFVFGLENALIRPGGKGEPAPEENMRKALAMIQAILGGKVE